MGIELDKTRAGFATERQGVLREKFPCLADRLKFTHASFLEQPGMGWKLGSKKRVIRAGFMIRAGRRKSRSAFMHRQASHG